MIKTIKDQSLTSDKKFLEDISNNSPNEGMFSEMNSMDFEEDLMGGKSLKVLKKQLKKSKMENKKK